MKVRWLVLAWFVPVVAVADTYTMVNLHVGGVATASPTSIADYATGGISVDFVFHDRRVFAIEEMLNVGPIGGSDHHIVGGLSSFLVFPVRPSIDLKAGLHKVLAPLSNDSLTAFMVGGRFSLTRQIGLDLLVGRSFGDVSSSFGVVGLTYTFADIMRFGEVIEAKTIPRLIKTALIRDTPNRNDRSPDLPLAAYRP